MTHSHNPEERRPQLHGWESLKIHPVMAYLMAISRTAVGPAVSWSEFEPRNRSTNLLCFINIKYLGTTLTNQNSIAEEIKS